jgi:hypothetical protein
MNEAGQAHKRGAERCDKNATGQRDGTHNQARYIYTRIECCGIESARNVHHDQCGALLLLVVVVVNDASLDSLEVTPLSERRRRPCHRPIRCHLSDLVVAVIRTVPRRRRRRRRLLEALYHGQSLHHPRQPCHAPLGFDLQQHRDNSTLMSLSHKVYQPCGVCRHTERHHKFTRIITVY